MNNNTLEIKTTSIEVYTPRKPNKNHEVLRQEFIKIKDFMRLYGVGRSTVYEWIKNGTLPEPTRITTRIVGWDREELKNALQK